MKKLLLLLCIFAPLTLRAQDDFDDAFLLEGYSYTPILQVKILLFPLGNQFTPALVHVVWVTLMLTVVLGVVEWMEAWDPGPSIRDSLLVMISSGMGMNLRLRQ